MVEEHLEEYCEPKLTEEQLGIYMKYLGEFSRRTSKHPNDIDPGENITHFGNLFLRYAGRNPMYKIRLEKVISHAKEIPPGRRRHLKRKFLGGEGIGNTEDLVDILMTRNETVQLYESIFKNKDE